MLFSFLATVDYSLVLFTLNGCVRNGGGFRDEDGCLKHALSTISGALPITINSDHDLIV